MHRSVQLIKSLGCQAGLVFNPSTPLDVLEAIAGVFRADIEEGDDDYAVQREDGSWLLDGLIPLPELKDRLGLAALPEEDKGRYQTLSGMTMLLLGRVPSTGDRVDWGGWRFEIVDMDGNRVDRVIVTRTLVAS